MDLEARVETAIERWGGTSPFLLPIQDDGRVLDTDKLKTEYPQFWNYLLGEEGDPAWTREFEAAIGRIRASWADIERLEGERGEQHGKTFGRRKTKTRQVQKYRSMGDEIWDLKQQHGQVVDEARSVLSRGWKSARDRLHKAIRAHVIQTHEREREEEHSYKQERGRMESDYQAARDKHLAAHKQWMEEFTQKCKEDRKRAEVDARQLGESFKDEEQALTARIAELEDRIVALKRAAEEDETRTLLAALEAANRLS